MKTRPVRLPNSRVARPESSTSWKRAAATCLIVMTIACLNAQGIRRESNGVVVMVSGAGAPPGTPRVEIQGAGIARPIRIPLNNHTETVTDVRFPRAGRVVIQGSLSKNYADNVLTVIDTASAQVIDSVWTRDLAFSPDGRIAAYQFRTPSSMGQTVLQTALVAYDLTASPALNSMPHAKGGDMAERGVVLYPENLRVTQQYWTAPEPNHAIEVGQPIRRFTSPIAWSPDGRSMAVVEHQANEDRLVVIDLSKGLRQPLIASAPVDRVAFLDAQLPEAIPREYPVFNSLRFSNDGQTILLQSWRLGPFAEKNVTLPVPVARQQE